MELNWTRFEVERAKNRRLKRLLNLIICWNEEAIRNQNQLKKEHETFPFPEWNKGYLECLNDLRGVIEENKHDGL